MRQCPECGCVRIISDFDPDVGKWLECKNCQHKWSEDEREQPLPARVLAMCIARNWSLHWTARGAYLHLEASELIEAIRGKHGDPKKEAADVLIVLQSITEANGIPWADVEAQAAMRVAELTATADKPYAGEERGGS